MLRHPLSFVFALSLTACPKDDGGGATDSDTDTDTDTDTDADSDADTDADTDTDTDTDPGCDAITDGTWQADGAALGGMMMTVDLLSDPPNCTFALDNWSMVMGPVPDGGTIVGDQVTLTGSEPSWATCVGTLTGGNQITGACGNGDDFMMNTTN